eukprot:2797000-Amphidinium_carterae.1
MSWVGMSKNALEEWPHGARTRLYKDQILAILPRSAAQRRHEENTVCVVFGANKLPRSTLVARTPSTQRVDNCIYSILCTKGQMKAVMKRTKLICPVLPSTLK